MKEQLTKCAEALEERGWEVNLGTDGAMFEWWSPAGEDFCIEAEDCADAAGMLRTFEREYESFDVDDHVALWAPMRGSNGVPESFRDLVEDAEAINAELEECVETIKSCM